MYIPKPLILASRSPRRAALLKQIGISFSVDAIDIHEYIDNHNPEVQVKNLATEKAELIARKYDNAIILGADTIVLIDNTILGKPVDKEDAFRMLNKLSDRRHTVITGFALIDKPSGKMITDIEKTFVTFRKLEDEEIYDYIVTGSPFDKAGAYGIQDDLGAVFVCRIEGCYYNVVGLPLQRVYCALRELIKPINVHNTRK